MATSSKEIPPRQKLLVALASFSALSAIAGSVELLVWQGGNPYLPIQLIEHTPFRSFLVPAVLLGIFVGGTSLACAALVWRRSAAAVDATILAGGALTVWVVAEVAIMRGVNWLHMIYGALGMVILWLGVRAAWRVGLPRHRWIISVTLAEAIGFLVPACAGILSAKTGGGELHQTALLVAAGFVEGLALGTGQAWAFPFPVRRLRYALLTAASAGIVWLCVMSMVLLMGRRDVPLAVVAVAGLVTLFVGLTAIGSAQWLELRRHAVRARRWIAWTALAWTVALPLSFAPAPFVDESTPLASHLVLWGAAGVLMAHVMALITWQGVRARGRPTSRPKKAGDRIGRYTMVHPALDRQLAMDAFAAIPTGHPMVALLEFDVTKALAAIAARRREGARVSLFAFLVRSIAVAISEHPDLNLVRHGKRLVRFDDVDVNVPVEVRTDDGSFPREVIIRRAQHRSAEDIYAELEGARERHEKTGETSDEDRWARSAMRFFSWLPSFVRVGIMRLIIRSAFRVKAHAGTTLVTSVGKFASIPGFSFTFSTGPRAAVFVIGGVVEKPWVHAGQIVLRSVLSTSVMVDHDLVDGAPAARFARRLQELVESADGLSNGTSRPQPDTCTASPAGEHAVREQ